MLCSIDDTYVEDVRRVLTVLSYSARPLTASQLIDAHAVDLGESPHLDREGRSYEQDDLVDICLGLIEIVETNNRDGETIPIARITHFSVQEYLQSDRIHLQKAAKFAVERESANAELAQICLTYLLDPTLSDGILDEVKLRDFPLADFAAKHWHQHYRTSEGKGRSDKLLLRLFQNDTNSFLTWVRIYESGNQRSRMANIERRIEDIASPIYYASFLGLETILRSLLASDDQYPALSKSVNAQGGGYGNALQAASSEGHEEVVQMLLDQGADVNAQGGGYGNALQAASSEGYKKVVQMLLNQGADVNAQGGHYGNALQAALGKGYKEVVKLLLDQGADINAQGGVYGNTLQAASSEGHKEIVQMLLDQGADVNAQGGHYGNALQAALENGHKEVVQMLLDQGADVNAQGGVYGNTLPAAFRQGISKHPDLTKATPFLRKSKGYFTCKWTGCTYPDILCSVGALWRHIMLRHVKTQHVAPRSVDAVEKTT
jgi:hypothetical protein